MIVLTIHIYEHTEFMQVVSQVDTPDRSILSIKTP